MSNPDRYVVISYMPLLEPPQPTFISESQDFSDHLAIIEQLPFVSIDACLWVENSETKEICPVLLIDGAKKVVDHIRKWSEDNVPLWFHLYIEKFGDNYTVLLFPNLEMSIRRFKMACLYYNETLVSGDAKFNIIFRALEFISKNAENYNKIKDRLSSETMLGFIDISEFDVNSPGSCLDKIDYIGPILLVGPDNASDQIKSYAAQAIEKWKEENK